LSQLTLTQIINRDFFTGGKNCIENKILAVYSLKKKFAAAVGTWSG
jgi:hypothetical protein